MSRHLDHVYASMVSDVVSGPTVIKDYRPKSAIRLEITNNIRAQVFWRNALGMVVTEAPSGSVIGEEFFYIKVEYEFEPGAAIDAVEFLNELDLPENHAARKAIIASLQQLESSPQWHNSRKFTYTLGISRARLEDHGGIVYLNDVDLLVGLARYKSEVLHPFSQPGLRQQLSNDLAQEEGLNTRILLIDNSGREGSRWINTGYDVYELIPVRDPKRLDGVYVTVKSGLRAEAKTTRYSLEEAIKKLGLYPNRTEAEAFGAPDVRFNAEIKQAERELALRKQELDREKLELEMERRQQEEFFKDEELRRKRETEELERIRDRMKLERDRWEYDQKYFADRQKFQYEMASRDRKDVSESLKGIFEVGKAILGILGALLSIYALMNKQK